MLFEINVTNISTENKLSSTVHAIQIFLEACLRSYVLALILAQFVDAPVYHRQNERQTLSTIDNAYLRRLSMSLLVYLCHYLKFCLVRSQGFGRS